MHPAFFIVLAVLFSGTSAFGGMVLHAPGELRAIAEAEFRQRVRLAIARPAGPEEWADIFTTVLDLHQHDRTLAAHSRIDESVPAAGFLVGVSQEVALQPRLAAILEEELRTNPKTAEVVYHTEVALRERAQNFEEVERLALGEGGLDRVANLYERMRDRLVALDTSWFQASAHVVLSQEQLDERAMKRAEEKNPAVRGVSFNRWRDEYPAAYISYQQYRQQEITEQRRARAAGGIRKNAVDEFRKMLKEGFADFLDTALQIWSIPGKEAHDVFMPGLGASARVDGPLTPQARKKFVRAYRSAVENSDGAPHGWWPNVEGSGFKDVPENIDSQWRQMASLERINLEHFVDQLSRLAKAASDPENLKAALREASSKFDDQSRQQRERATAFRRLLSWNTLEPWKWRGVPYITSHSKLVPDGVFALAAKVDAVVALNPKPKEEKYSHSTVGDYRLEPTEVLFPRLDSTSYSPVRDLPRGKPVFEFQTLAPAPERQLIPIPFPRGLRVVGLEVQQNGVPLSRHQYDVIANDWGEIFLFGNGLHEISFKADYAKDPRPKRRFLGADEVPFVKNREKLNAEIRRLRNLGANEFADELQAALQFRSDRSEPVSILDMADAVKESSGYELGSSRHVWSSSPQGHYLKLNRRAENGRLKLNCVETKELLRELFRRVLEPEDFQRLSERSVVTRGPRNGLYGQGGVGHAYLEWTAPDGRVAIVDGTPRDPLEQSGAHVRDALTEGNRVSAPWRGHEDQRPIRVAQGDGFVSRDGEVPAQTKSNVLSAASKVVSQMAAAMSGIPGVSRFLSSLLVVTPPANSESALMNATPKQTEGASVTPSVLAEKPVQPMTRASTPSTVASSSVPEKPVLADTRPGSPLGELSSALDGVKDAVQKALTPPGAKQPPPRALPQADTPVAKAMRLGAKVAEAMAGQTSPDRKLPLNADGSLDMKDELVGIQAQLAKLSPPRRIKSQFDRTVDFHFHSGVRPQLTRLLTSLDRVLVPNGKVPERREPRPSMGCGDVSQLAE